MWPDDPLDLLGLEPIDPAEMMADLLAEDDDGHDPFAGSEGR